MDIGIEGVFDDGSGQDVHFPTAVAVLFDVACANKKDQPLWPPPQPTLSQQLARAMMENPDAYTDRFVVSEVAAGTYIEARNRRVLEDNRRQIAEAEQRQREFEERQRKELESAKERDREGYREGGWASG